MDNTEDFAQSPDMTTEQQYRNEFNSVAESEDRYMGDMGSPKQYSDSQGYMGSRDNLLSSPQNSHIEQHQPTSPYENKLGVQRSESSPSPQNDFEKNKENVNSAKDRSQEPWYEGLHRMRFKRTQVSLVPAQELRPFGNQSNQQEVAPPSEEETQSDLRSRGSSRSSKSQRSSLSDVSLPGRRSFVKEDSNTILNDRISVKSNKTASSRKSSGASSSGQASLIERINRAESSHLIGEFGRTGSSVGSLKDDFSKPSSGRGIKGLDSTQMSGSESGQGTARTETTSIQEPLRNPALDPLRSGSDLGMSFQRYGSMQSIPEHEPTQSEVLNDEGDPHYKDSMVSESYQSEGFGLMSMGNRGRLARNQNSEFTMEEERAYRHDSASMNSHASSDFITAVQKGDSSFVKQALDNPNLNPEKKTRFQQRTALHLAAGYGQFSVAEELLYAGVEPSCKAENGRTPLHEAAQGGHDKVLQLLLDYTRDVEVKDRDGRTACHLAAYHGEVKCMEILMDKGAQLVVKDTANRQPAHLAAMRNHRDILEYLYDKGVDLSCEDNSGKLPVHYAAQFGALDCLICLVERECDITLPDSSGNLPIHFAAWNDHLDCIRFLVKQGTSLEVLQGENRTPAHVAALHGSYKVLHWLCEKGCNVDSLDKYGNTALHLAGEAGKPKCFNCLLQHDASLTVVNKYNSTPLESAKKMGHKLAMEKAMTNTLPCPLCRQQFEFEEWEEQTAPPPVVRTVSRMATVAFSSPLPKPPEKVLTPIEVSAERRKKKLLKKRKQSSSKATDREGSGTSKSIFSYQKEAETTKKRLPKRDLPTKYFGEYLTTVGELYKLKI